MRWSAQQKVLLLNTIARCIPITIVLELNNFAMKFAILSDSHDNLTNALKAIDYLNQEKIMVAIHCGDIASEETIKAIEERFKGEISFVRGNADFAVKQLPDTLDLDI